MSSTTGSPGRPGAPVGTARQSGLVPMRPAVPPGTAAATNTSAAKRASGSAANVGTGDPEFGGLRGAPTGCHGLQASRGRFGTAPRYDTPRAAGGEGGDDGVHCSHAGRAGGGEPR